MSIDLKIITITNSMYQLNALPVGESVFISFNAKPDLDSVKTKINISRVDDGIIVPFAGDPNAIQMSYVKQTYGSIPFTPKLTQSGSEWILEIDPNEPLITNSTYYLFVEKGLLPESYSITKPITLGNSSIVLTKLATPASNNTYEITITQTSQLSSGSHKIKYSLIKNGITVSSNTEIDIATNVLVLEPAALSVSFNKNVPFLNTEKFVITAVAATSLTENKVQTIKTYLDAQVIKSEDNPSKRLDYEDVNNFYKNFVWGSSTAPQVVTAATSRPVKLSYVGLDVIELEIPYDVDMSSVIQDNIKLSFSPAFNNYLLDKLDLYSKESKYVLYMSKNSNKIYFRVQLDTDGLVDIGEKYIIIEE